jgi:hypothetical protein
MFDSVGLMLSFNHLSLIEYFFELSCFLIDVVVHFHASGDGCLADELDFHGGGG